MPGGHVYIDESSQHDYLVICSFVPSNSVDEARKALNKLLLKGQRSLHMKDERDARKVQLLTAILALEPDVRIYVARPQDHGGHASARALCLREAAHDATRQRVQRFVLDRHDAAERHDRRAIADGARKAGLDSPPFEYLHMQRKDEPMLWVPDAIGWAWARGGQWRSRVAGVVRIIEL